MRRRRIKMRGEAARQKAGSAGKKRGEAAKAGQACKSETRGKSEASRQKAGSAGKSGARRRGETEKGRNYGGERTGGTGKGRPEGRPLVVYPLAG